MNQRLKPARIEAIEKMREIASSHMAGEVNGVLVDAPSAAVTTHVYDGLNNANKERMTALCVGEMVEIAWSVAWSVGIGWESY